MCKMSSKAGVCRLQLRRSWLQRMLPKSDSSIRGRLFVSRQPFWAACKAMRTRKGTAFRFESALSWVSLLKSQLETNPNQLVVLKSSGDGFYVSDTSTLPSISIIFVCCSLRLLAKIIDKMCHLKVKDSLWVLTVFLSWQECGRKGAESREPSPEEEDGVWLSCPPSQQNCNSGCKSEGNRLPQQTAAGNLAVCLTILEAVERWRIRAAEEGETHQQEARSNCPQERSACVGLASSRDQGSKRRSRGKPPELTHTSATAGQSWPQLHGCLVEFKGEAAFPQLAGCQGRPCFLALACVHWL